MIRIKTRVCVKKSRLLSGVFTLTLPFFDLTLLYWSLSMLYYTGSTPNKTAIPINLTSNTKFRICPPITKDRFNYESLSLNRKKCTAKKPPFISLSCFLQPPIHYQAHLHKYDRS